MVGSAAGFSAFILHHSSFMSPAAVREAALRHQRHAEAHHGKRITIGTATMTAAVILGAVQHRMDENGVYRRIQPITVTVLKSLLPTAPAKKSVITYAGADYQVDEVAGQNAADVAWHIKAERKLPAPS